MSATNKTSGPSDALLQRLTEVFQDHGFEGATLSILGKATGLGRASLYHHFPGGKQDMVDAVLARTERWIRTQIVAPLGGDGSPAERVRAMADRLAELYQSGRKSCLTHTLALGEPESSVRSSIQQALTLWRKAMEKVSFQALGDRPIAKRRALEALIRVQGSLVVSRGLDDTRPFLQVLRDLPTLLTEH